MLEFRKCNNFENIGIMKMSELQLPDMEILEFRKCQNFQDVRIFQKEGWTDREEG